MPSQLNTKSPPIYTRRLTFNSAPSLCTNAPPSNFFFHFADSYLARINVIRATVAGSAASATTSELVHVHRPKAQLRM